MSSAARSVPSDSDTLRAAFTQVIAQSPFTRWIGMHGILKPAH